MAAKIYDTEHDLRVIAAPAGQWGWGTVGAANPELALGRAWRMVQRAGLARVADKSTATFEHWGERVVIAFALRDDCDWNAIPDNAWAY